MKKHQLGFSTGIIVALSILGVLVAAAGFIAISYIGAYNCGNAAERGIVASYKDNQNVLSNYTLKVAEAAQVPAMQRDDLTKVIEAALGARYGADGSKAAFQWIKEQNPTIDSSVYTKIQQIIEAGRNDFQRNQTQLLDRKRGYETQLGSFWRGLWLGIAGYPKIDLDAYDIIVESDTRTKFETKTDEALNLRQP